MTSDNELINSIRQGDKHACTLLMQAHQEAVFRLAYLFLRNTADADDVAQDVFIRVYHQLHRFDTNRPFRPWLLHITRNLALNRQRSLQRRFANWQRLARDKLPGADVEQQVIIQHEQDTLLQAVHKLRDIDREVIYLRYFMALSIEETADILQVKPGTVKSRLHRALERLRHLIQDDYPLLMEGRQI
ncbi:MAG: RNA polymerase sigma factor [Aggregatilineales bacterium]